MSKSVVLAYALRIRQGPGTNYPTVGYLRRDDVVEVLGATPDGIWNQIRTDKGTTGWSAANYMMSLDDEPVPPPGDDSSTDSSYRVTANALYIRSGPGTNYPILGYLRKDEVVDGLATNAAGDWIQIRRPNGSIGWCSARYLVALEKPPEPEPQPDGQEGIYYRVTAYALNIRSGPSTSYAVLGYLPNGTIVRGLSISPDGQWMNIERPGGSTGWCSLRYMIQVPPATPEPQVDDLDKTGLHRVTKTVLEMHENPDSTSPVTNNLEFEDVVDVVNISPDRAWKKVATAFGKLGWCDTHYLDSIASVAELQADEEFPWMPIAFAELGLREFPGAPDNPRILEYLMSTSLKDSYPYLPDETDWCAAFVNWCIEKAGIYSTNSALVYPWRNWGRALQTPRRGCLVTFTWEDGGQHASFYLGTNENGDRTYALGGNQSDAVWVKSYETKFVTAYRIPGDWPE